VDRPRPQLASLALVGGVKFLIALGRFRKTLRSMA
jgi:hypothetical protein